MNETALASLRNLPTPGIFPAGYRISCTANVDIGAGQFVTSEFGNAFVVVPEPIGPAPAAPSTPMISVSHGNAGTLPSAPANDNTPTLHGTGEPFATVTVLNGSVVVCTVVVEVNGDWSCTPTPQVDGTHTFSARQTDRAGHASALSSASAPWYLDTAAETGTIDNPLNDTTVERVSTVSGTGAGAGAIGAVIAVQVDNAVAVCLNAPVAVDVSGHYSCALAEDITTTGRHMATVTLTDAAGNVSDPALVSMFTIASNQILDASVTDSGADGGIDPNADPDDDGLTNREECPGLIHCDDSDQDGLQDYQDPDDDNDGIATRVERSDSDTFGADVDLDGRPNWLDPDADSDGLRDGLDGRNRGPNGRPNYLDPNSPLRTGGLSGGGGGCSIQTRGRGGVFIGLCLLAALCLRRKALTTNGAAAHFLRPIVPWMTFDPNTSRGAQRLLAFGCVALASCVGQVSVTQALDAAVPPVHPFRRLTLARMTLAISSLPPISSTVVAV